MRHPRTEDEELKDEVSAGSVASGSSAVVLAKRGHLTVIVGQKVSDHNSHGALGEQLAGGVVVNRRDFHDVALVQAVPAAIGKTDDRQGDDATARVELGLKLGDILLAGGIHQAQLPSVIVH